jgi:hypothetical protein
MAKSNTAAGMRVEVLLNGRSVAIAGVEEFGVVSTIVTWVKRRPGKVPDKVRSREGFDEAEFLREQCTLEISGLDSVSEKHQGWAREALQPGSEITIRVLGPGEFNPPTEV